MVASAMAVPCPLAAGISAIRQSASFASSPVSPGLVSAAMAAGWAFAYAWATAACSCSDGRTPSSSEQRPSSLSARPMWKSASSGPAISDPKNRPGLCPVIRQMTSPMR